MLAEVCDPSMLHAGEQALVRAVTTLRGRVEEAVQAEGGIVLKIDGDGVFCVFADPVASVRASRFLAESSGNQSNLT
jgi:class 3 adenylate cyclase